MPNIGINVGPMLAALAVLAGVIKARETGVGCELEVAQSDASAYLDWYRIETERAYFGPEDAVTGNVADDFERRPAGLAGMWVGVRYQAYEAKDGHVLLMASEWKFWRNFCGGVGRMDLFEKWPGAKYADHASRNLELQLELREIFKARTVPEWMIFASDYDTTIAPFNSPASIADDPHFKARMGFLPTDLEAFVHFEKEVSAVLARFLDGEICFYAVAENDHRRHVLHTSHVPAEVSPALVERAERISAKIATELGHVGMMAVELFLTRDGDLLVNEIAPRTHNSGHYTFGACVTSKFEQHVRVVCGLVPGDATQLRPAVMLNLLGDLWSEGPPDWNIVLSDATAWLHLYGKSRASAGRKMGHVLVLDDTLELARVTADRITRELEERALARSRPIEFAALASE